MRTCLARHRRVGAPSLVAAALFVFASGQARSQITPTIGQPLFAALESGSVQSFDSLTAAANGNFSPISSVPDSAGISASAGLLYVTNYDHDVAGQGYVSVFNESTGAALQTPLISGLNGPNGILATGNNVYVSTLGTGSGGSIAEYNASTGALNPAFSTINDTDGNTVPYNLAVIGNNLFVALSGYGTAGHVNEYNATTGAPEAAFGVANQSAFITTYNPTGLATLGTILYVSDPDGDINSYDTTTGLHLQSFSITPNVPTNPHAGSDPGSFGIAIANGSLYSANYYLSDISQTNLATGLVSNYTFESNLTDVYSVTFDSSLPEPAPAGLIGVAFLIFLSRRRRGVMHNAPRFAVA